MAGDYSQNSSNTSKNMKILIIVNNDIDTDPRVINQWEALKEHAEIHFFANSVKNIHHTSFFNFASVTRKYIFHYQYPVLARKIITFFIMLLKTILRFYAKLKYKNPYQRRYWQYVKINKLKKIKNTHTYDYIIANDIDTLPIAAYLKKENIKLIFDAHEYFLDEDDSLSWVQHEYPFRKYLIETYLKEIDIFMTVGDNIAQRFQKELNLDKKPIVIYNAKPYFNHEPNPINPNKIRMVHHGVALPNRNLEALIHITEKLPAHFELHFYLKKINEQYYQKLYNLSTICQRVFFHTPVPFNEIIPTIHQYDIGIYLIEKNNYNNANCLPNKLFEFIQAKLMLIMSSTHEIEKFIQKYQNGIILQDDMQDMVNQIKNLTSEQIYHYKQKSADVSKFISAEKEWQKIREILGIQD